MSVLFYFKCVCVSNTVRSFKISPVPRKELKMEVHTLKVVVRSPVCWCIHSVKNLRKPLLYFFSV